MKEDYENINKKERLERNMIECAKRYSCKFIVKREGTEYGMREIYVESDSKTGELELVEYYEGEEIRRRLLALL